MICLKKFLVSQEKRYIHILDGIRNEQTDFPKGYLIIRSGKVPRYYQCNSYDEKMNKRYLDMRHIELAKKLATKSYYRKLERLLERRLGQLQRLNREYKDSEIEDIYLNLSEERRSLISPVEPTYEKLLDDWRIKEYKGLDFENNDNEIYTNNRERVRSKSEKILADKFLALNIAYKYECPLSLLNGYTIYPDFTFFNPYTNEEIYWEHFGMIDNTNYAKTMISKLELYANNNIFVGDRLIVTFESSHKVININYIDTLINRHLLHRI